MITTLHLPYILISCFLWEQLVINTSTHLYLYACPFLPVIFFLQTANKYSKYVSSKYSCIAGRSWHQVLISNRRDLTFYTFSKLGSYGVWWAGVAWKLSSHPVHFITAPQWDKAENQKSKSKKSLLSVLAVNINTVCYMKKKLKQCTLPPQKKQTTTKTKTQNKSRKQVPKRETFYFV